MIFAARRRVVRAPAARPWTTADRPHGPARVLSLGWALTTAAMVFVHLTEWLPRAAAAEATHGLADRLGLAALVAVGNGLFAAYLALTHASALWTARRLVPVMVVCVLALLATRIVAASPAVPPHLTLFAPTVLVALVCTVALGQRLAAEVTGLGVVHAALVLHGASLATGVASATPGADAGPGPLATITVLAAGALLAVLGARRIRTRSRLLKVGAAVGALQAGLWLCWNLPALLGGPELAHARELALVDAAALLGHGCALGLVVSGALPFLEAVFDVVTDISLLELSNQDHPLLRRLLLTAPGTYHHSFIVGILVEAGCEAVGANALLGRVGAYYHDIGKSQKPQYFTENEGRKGLLHARLSPTLSALVIKAHTKDGVVLAREYNLPEQIIAFIPQHHGTSVIEFFYQEALSQESQTGTETERVDRDAFRHDGPKPQTKETAIMHLADSVEAASRSLSEPTPSRLRDLVHNIIWRKLEDGQLDECDLTFRELRLVEEAFVRVLLGIFHTRIAYPSAAQAPPRRG